MVGGARQPTDRVAGLGSANEVLEHQVGGQLHLSALAQDEEVELRCSARRQSSAVTWGDGRTLR